MTEDLMNPDSVEPQPLESESELPSPFDIAEPPPLPEETAEAVTTTIPPIEPPPLPDDSDLAIRELPPVVPLEITSAMPPEVPPALPIAEEEGDEKSLESEAPASEPIKAGPIEFEPTPVASASPVSSPASEATPSKKDNQTLIIVIAVVAVLLLLCCCCVAAIAFIFMASEDISQYTLFRSLLSLLL